MSEQSAGVPGSQPADDETTLSAGVAGPSGTGELTDAGADPAAPALPLESDPSGPASQSGSPVHHKEQA